MSNVKPKDLAISSHPKALGLIVTVQRKAFEGDVVPGYDFMNLGPLANGLTWWCKPPRLFRTRSGLVLAELLIPDCWLRPVSGLPDREQNLYEKEVEVWLKWDGKRFQVNGVPAEVYNR